jgi:hypothetical protein
MSLKDMLKKEDYDRVVNMLNGTCLDRSVKEDLFEQFESDFEEFSYETAMEKLEAGIEEEQMAQSDRDE